MSCAADRARGDVGVDILKSKSLEEPCFAGKVYQILASLNIQRGRHVGHSDTGVDFGLPIEIARLEFEEI